MYVHLALCINNPTITKYVAPVALKSPLRCHELKSTLQNIILLEKQNGNLLLRELLLLGNCQA